MGDTTTQDGHLWTVESTGGNCTAWTRAASDACDSEGNAPRWLITESGEACALPPTSRARVSLSLEDSEGSLLLGAECSSFVVAARLAARFGSPS